MKRKEMEMLADNEQNQRISVGWRRRCPEKKNADMVEVAAVSASLLCLAHCLALPLLLLMLPGLLGVFLLSESFHIAALAFILPSALLAFWLGYRRHRALMPAILGTLGVVLLAGAVMPDVHHQAETLLTVGGSVFLVLAHGLNWRLRAHVAGLKYAAPLRQAAEAVPNP